MAGNRLQMCWKISDAILVKEGNCLPPWDAAAPSLQTTYMFKLIPDTEVERVGTCTFVMGEMDATGLWAVSWCDMAWIENCSVCYVWDCLLQMSHLLFCRYSGYWFSQSCNVISQNLVGVTQGSRCLTHEHMRSYSSAMLVSWLFEI
jgi:hypothetical protein